MSKYSLIPGMEAFMEDTSVEVDVEVGAPEEVIEEQAEAVEEEATVVEETTEAEADAEQAEMIFQQYDRIETYLNHAKKYGVDRTFLSLLNSDGSLSQAIGYSLPACESFDVTGSPMSAESQAVIAGLEGVFSTIWEFIKKIARKIRDFFSNVWNAIISRFGDIDAQIGKLKTASNNRTWDNSKSSDFKSDILTKENYDRARNKMNEFWSNSYVAECQKYLDGVRQGKYSETYNGEKAKETIKKAHELIKDAKKELKTSSPSGLKDGVQLAMLNEAANIRKWILAHQQERRTFEMMSKMLEESARQAEKHEDIKADSNSFSANLRKAAGYVNEAFSTFALAVGVADKAARMLVSSAAKIINGCMRREGEERE